MKDLEHLLRDAGATPYQAYRLRLTPELARLLLQRMVPQRPLRRGRVARYRKYIRDGQWFFTGQGLIFNREGLLMNGQHTCTAVIEEDTAIDIIVIVGIDNEAWRFLDQGGERSAADFLPECPSRNIVAGALNWLWREERGFNESIAGFHRIDMPPSEAPLMLARYPGIENVVATYTSRIRRLMAPSLGCYAYFRARLIDEAAADQFFDRLINGENLLHGSTVLLLRERLLANRTGKAKLPGDELAALIIKAWLRKSEPTRHLRWRASGPQVEPFPAWPGLPIASFSTYVREFAAHVEAAERKELDPV